MEKNRVMFFQVAIVGVIAIFLFLGTFDIFAAPQAHAYAIGSSATAGANAPGGSFNIGSSLQNLVSPFTNFFNSFHGNSNGAINVNGTNVALPSVNVSISTSATGASVQNLLSQWVSEFDNWFYGVSGVQLSGIMVAILGVFSWALGLAQQVVNWLVGLFH